MTQLPATESSKHVASTWVGVVLGLAAGALLLVASVVFVFYGYCEDYCEKPPRAVWPALGAALPFALAGLIVMAVACYLFMRGRRPTRPSYLKAAGLAALSSVGFIAGLWLLGVALGALSWSDDGIPLVLGVLVFVSLWMRSTVALARCAVRPTRHGQF